MFLVLSFSPFLCVCLLVRFVTCSLYPISSFVSENSTIVAFRPSKKGIINESNSEHEGKVFVLHSEERFIYSDSVISFASLVFTN